MKKRDYSNHHILSGKAFPIYIRRSGKCAYLYTAAILLFLSPTALSAANIEFSGNSLKVLEYDAEKSTGLEKIYVVYDLNNVELSFPTQGKSITWSTYGNLGGGYAEEIASVERDGKSVVSRSKGDLGYIVNDGDRNYCFWIVEYKNHRLHLQSVAGSPDSDCDFSILEIEGSGDPIHYYTINGQPKVLSRDIRVNYDTQVWNENSNSFETVAAVKNLESLSSRVSITPPAYCSTSFLVEGDRFLEAWNWLEEAESAVVAPKAVDVRASADQIASEESENGSNVIGGNDSGLGGSAPAEIKFNSYTTESVIHTEWQMSEDSEFETIDYRFNERDLNYVFSEEGTFYLRFVGSDSDGSCVSTSDVFTVNIGSSELKCPNAFSPDGDGDNDEWKVAYRSLIEFKCWIFDRYGSQMCYFDSPDKGWDGKHKGKIVKPGVYYYVIQAKGADGKKYKKSGDINILRYKSYGDSGSSQE